MASKKPSVDRLLEFQHLLLAFSQIERRPERKHADSYVHETDTEHSYNLALTAWFLCQYFPKLDRSEAIRLALVHDLVEIHAGDTYAYGKPSDIASQAGREAKALQQLERDWPDFPDLISSIKSYEACQTEEAKFVYALDKIMPMMLVYTNEGHSWQKEGLTVAQIHKVKLPKVSVSKEIKPYYDALYKLLLDSPQLIPSA